MPVAFAALIAAAAAACGGGAPSEAPIAIPSAASSPNPSSPTVSGETIATLTLGNFGEADGPGESVRDAIANAGVEPRLVNGILLRQVDGKVWLCEAFGTCLHRIARRLDCSSRTGSQGTRPLPLARVSTKRTACAGLTRCNSSASSAPSLRSQSRVLTPHRRIPPPR
jgi:hypothetical protein